MDPDFPGFMDAQQQQHVQMHLTLLPNKLYLASLPKSKLAAHMHTIYKLLFLIEQEGRFFSYTETEDDLSFILDREAYDAFPPGTLEVGLDQGTADDIPVWRIIEVSEGSLGFTETGVVHSLSATLAKAGISIFYISTFNTDFALVEEKSLSQAIAVLQRSFILATEGVEDLPQSSSQTAAEITPHMPANVSKLALMRGDHQLCRLTREVLSPLLFHLTKLIFYPDQPNQFFSWTECAGSFSLMITREAVSEFPPGLLDCSDEAWNVLKVDDGPLGFIMAGIVQAVSEPLSALRVSIFYLSTYLTDYLLVRGIELDKSMTALQQKFTVVKR